VVWWSRWSELSGATRDVVDVVGARQSCSGRGRCGRGRRGRSSVELLETWSTWSELGVARSAARRGLLDGSLRLANGSDSLFDGLESHLGDDVTVGDLVVMR